MTNGNGSNFYADVRMKLMNLRMKHNEDYDDFSKWVDESEQQMLARNKAMPIKQVKDDSVVEIELVTKGGSEEA